MHVDPNSPRAELTKRQQEVLERLERGDNVKQIATDIGVSRNAVYQHIERLRRQGALAETYTPSGQPPRRAEASASVAIAPAPVAPRASAVARLRELARTETPATPRTRRPSRARSPPATRSGSPTSSAASTPSEAAGCPRIWSSRPCAGWRSCRPTSRSASK